MHPTCVYIFFPKKNTFIHMINTNCSIELPPWFAFKASSFTFQFLLQKNLPYYGCFDELIKKCRFLNFPWILWIASLTSQVILKKWMIHLLLCSSTSITIGWIAKANFDRVSSSEFISLYICEKYICLKWDLDTWISFNQWCRCGTLIILWPLVQSITHFDLP